MKLREQRLFVPWIGKSVNQLTGHWHHYHQNSVVGRRNALLAIRIATLKPIDYPVTLTSVPHCLANEKGKYDCTNYFFAHKTIEDALVSAGILKNDSGSVVKSSSILAPVFTGTYGIELIIQEY